ncbi:hypothetical protein [Actinoallomurus sp. NPDC050550]|uniref:hypothetical protein n=1 Tax=Actinoallomurus sp. NPDC050550 TaxID=3154937 RepID=UPI0033CCFB8D
MRLRFNAAENLTLIIVAFALTVVGLRGYLWITGYPQVGGKTLHIAHLLWGGVALFIAALLLVLTTSVRTTRVAALLIGLGWGLFLDEVGKFITKSNDYFYKPAAAIIYIVFLFCAIILFIFRHEDDATKRRAAIRLAHALEVLPDMVRDRLVSRETKMVRETLHGLCEHNDEVVARLAQAMRDYGEAHGVKSHKNPLEMALEATGRVIGRFLRSRWCAWAVVIMLLIRTLHGVLSGGVTLLVKVLPTAQSHTIVQWVAKVTRGGPFQPFGWTWAGMIGVALNLVVLVGLYRTFRGHSYGRKVALAALILSLATVDIADFYYNQFRATAAILTDMLALIYIERHSHRIHRDELLGSDDKDDMTTTEPTMA